MNVVRTPELAVVRIAMCSVVALVLGSLFWMTDADQQGLGERSAYFAFGEKKKNNRITAVRCATSSETCLVLVTYAYVRGEYFCVV